MQLSCRKDITQRGSWKRRQDEKGEREEAVLEAWHHTNAHFFSFILVRSSCFLLFMNLLLRLFKLGEDMHVDFSFKTQHPSRIKMKSRRTNSKDMKKNESLKYIKVAVYSAG